MQRGWRTHLGRQRWQRPPPETGWGSLRCGRCATAPTIEQKSHQIRTENTSGRHHARYLAPTWSRFACCLRFGFGLLRGPVRCCVDRADGLRPAGWRAVAGRCGSAGGWTGGVPPPSQLKPGTTLAPSGLPHNPRQLVQRRPRLTPRRARAGQGRAATARCSSSIWQASRRRSESARVRTVHTPSQREC